MRTPLAAAHHLTWVESLVAGAAWDQFDAHLSGDIVSVGGIVWTDTTGGDPDLRALTRYGNTSIAGGVGNQSDADISGDIIAYASDTDGESDAFTQDLSTGIRTPVADSASPEINPVISGRRVVFLRSGN